MIVEILLMALLVTNWRKIYVSQKMIHKSYFLEARGFTMSDHIEIENSDLFINLSEKEQESISGGGSSSSPLERFDIFYQNINISTRGMSEMNVSQGNSSGYVRNETEYQFSQTTFILSSLFGRGGGRRRNRSRKGNSFLASIFNLF
ncbi:hypothetical protein [Dolichospermum planctonicum]|uniref:Uncharacterized protein n=2 Tax=Dolichospermum TaxID=748770 RepID=A0A480AG59_9CYAN|nr:hypothetical protein [Dolichospermum planctonicum]GCL43026.1 hypothetical protein NIES80_27370 [Dolichospermum planctonicum]